MDNEAKQALRSTKTPHRPINFVPVQSGEILKLGHITCRIMEDGSRTGELFPPIINPQAHNPPFMALPSPNQEEKEEEEKKIHYTTS